MENLVHVVRIMNRYNSYHKVLSNEVNSPKVNKGIISVKSHSSCGSSFVHCYG